MNNPRHMHAFTSLWTFVNQSIAYSKECANNVDGFSRRSYYLVSLWTLHSLNLSNLPSCDDFHVLIWFTNSQNQNFTHSPYLVLTLLHSIIENKLGWLWIFRKPLSIKTWMVLKTEKVLNILIFYRCYFR